MRKKLRSCLLVFLCFLTGCLPTAVVEDVQMVLTIGFDYLDESHNIATVSFVIFKPSEGQSAFTNIPALVVAHSFNDAIQQFNQLSPRRVLSGKLSTILLDQKLAKHGIIELVQGISRNPDVGRNLFVVIAEPSSHDLLTKQYDISQTVSEYLRKMLEQNKGYNFPKVNLHEFLNNYYGKGIDPILPIVSRREDKLTINGLGIFRKDRLVYKISQDDLFFFKILFEAMNDGMYELEYDGHEIAIGRVQSQRTIRFNQDHVNPEFDIHISATGNLHESREKIKLYLRDLKRFEAKAKEHLEKKSLEMIKKLQARGIDPLGFGKTAMSQDRKWDDKEWHEKIYPKAKFHITCDFEITEMGTME